MICLARPALAGLQEAEMPGRDAGGGGQVEDLAQPAGDPPAPQEVPETRPSL